ncbi:hypothetical protein LSPH26S_03803 [Lysinibacillus sphaericus]
MLARTAPRRLDPGQPRSMLLARVQHALKKAVQGLLLAGLFRRRLRGCGFLVQRVADPAAQQPRHGRRIDLETGRARRAADVHADTLRGRTAQHAAEQAPGLGVAEQATSGLLATRHRLIELDQHFEVEPAVSRHAALAGEAAQIGDVRTGRLGVDAGRCDFQRRGGMSDHCVLRRLDAGQRQDSTELRAQAVAGQTRIVQGHQDLLPARRAGRARAGPATLPPLRRESFGSTTPNAGSSGCRSSTGSCLPRMFRSSWSTLPRLSKLPSTAKFNPPLPRVIDAAGAVEQPVTGLVVDAQRLR